MPHKHPLQSLIAELKRRRVFRVAAVYALVAWALIQGAGTLVPLLELPTWVGKLVVVLVALGFPIALVLAWAFDITPEGVQRTANESAAEELTPAALPRPRASLRWLAVAGVVAVVALAAAVLLRYRAVTTSPTVVAVLPFGVRGSATYLGDGLVDLLSRNLDGAERLRSVDPGTVLSLAKQNTTTELGVPGARKIAEQLGAGMFVLGTINQSGAVLRISAVLHEVAGDQTDVQAQASVEGDSTRLFQLVDELTAQLLGSRKRGSASARLAETASLTTQSLPALKAFLSAEQHLRAADFDSAMAGYQKAVDLDSTFALAHYRFAMSAAWSGRAATGEPAIAKALRHAARLPERDRRLLHAYDAFRSGKADSAEALYESIRRDYPDDVEATFQLADVKYHYNPARARPWTEARGYFERVLRSDPEFLCPI